MFVAADHCELFLDSLKSLRARMQARIPVVQGIKIGNYWVWAKSQTTIDIYPLVNKHRPWQIGVGRLVSIKHW